MLTGYKTYIVGVLAILGAGGGFLDGDLTAPAAIQMAITAIMGMTLRAGVSSAKTK